MAKTTFFITGTDTDAGKTFCTAALLQAANNDGRRTLGLKPVASGCDVTPDGLRNSDANILMAHASEKIDYDLVNPFSFEPAIAPHIAAVQQRRPLSVDSIVGRVRGALLKPQADFICIEGAGGWRVPLNPREYFSDIPKALNVPVILVVGMKLGCINHALLTVEAIRQDGLQLAGWIANKVDESMSVYDENLMTLQSLIPAPMLGEVPFIPNQDPKSAAQYIDLTQL